MSRQRVTFTKTVEAVVEADNYVEALRTALMLEGLKPAFDEAQTTFVVTDVDDGTPLGIVVQEKLPEVF